MTTVNMNAASQTVNSDMAYHSWFSY